MNKELVVLVTVGSTDEASNIAEALVEAGLAACVNIVSGVVSIYRWEGKINRDNELLLIIKTTGERYSLLETQIKQLHSYTTPEIIAFEIERGSASYLEWLRESVAAPKE